MSSLKMARAMCSEFSKRYIHTTSVTNSEIPSLTKLKQIQTKFQADNGKPVFLRGGPVDHILYNVTWAACGLGMAMSIHFIFNMAKPPS